VTHDRLAAISPVRETHPPDSAEWEDALLRLSARFDRDETLQWAANQLSSSSVALRQFVASLLLTMSFDKDAVAPELVDALKLRLFAETDPNVLEQLIGAFAEYSTPRDTEDPVELREILPLARHTDPAVRWRVADELVRIVGASRQHRHYEGTLASSDPRVEVVAVVIGLAGDVVGRVRTAALRTLAESGLDIPQVRDVMVAHLTDEHPDAQLEAVAGLALRADPRGRDALQQMSGSTEFESDAWFRIDSVERILAYRAEAARDNPMST
jgi:hypothetical protein